MRFMFAAFFFALTTSAFVRADDTNVQVRASHILVETKQQAEDLYERIHRYEDLPTAFATFAKTYSKDPSTKERDGDLGYFDPGAMVKPFSDVAFSLAVGQVSRPVQTQFGWHLIYVADKRTKPDELMILASSLANHLGLDWREVTHSKDAIHLLNAKSVRKESGGYLSAWFFSSFLHDTKRYSGKPV